MTVSTSSISEILVYTSHQILEGSSRARKPTRQTVYYSVLNETSIESKEVFYTIFSSLSRDESCSFYVIHAVSILN